MELNERRALLEISDNPNKAADYIVSLEGGSEDRRLRLSVRYVPDRDVLNSPSFSRYADALLSMNDTSLEKTVAMLVDDFNNELVVRWVQVTAFEDREDGTQHSVIIEDRQPQWDNPHLLSRLSKI